MHSITQQIDNMKDWTKIARCKCGVPLYVPAGTVMVSAEKFDEAVAERWAEMTEEQRTEATNRVLKTKIENI